MNRTCVSRVLTSAFKHEDAMAAPQNAVGGGVLSMPLAKQYTRAATPWMPVAKPTFICKYAVHHSISRGEDDEAR